MRKILAIAILVLASSSLFGQQVLKTLTVSNSFSTTAGTPRVVRNGFQHVWLVAWRQQGGPSKILGRIINSDGSTLAIKTLASAVSTADQNFDIAYDSVAYTYLVAYENAGGLQVQLFNQALVKQGTPSLIEGGVSGVIPRLTYDPVGKKFLVFWLSTKDGAPRGTLKSRALDIHGKPTADAKTLATAATGKTYASFSICTNQKNGMILALIGEQTSTGGDLVGFLVKADGSLQKPQPNVFQPTTAGLKTASDAGFADAGTGYGFWVDHASMKYRKVSPTLGFASPTKALASTADANSFQPSIIWDSRNNQFIGVWSQGNSVRGVVLDTNTGAVLKQPFAIATSTLANARDLSTSYDAQVGNVLAVWEDASVNGTIPSQTGAKFQVRAAIFFIPGNASSSAISIGDDFFSPNNLTVATGTTVVWTHNGNNRHTVTSDTPAGLFDSGDLNHGQTFSFRFTQEGEIHYSCRVHGVSMSGIITVTSTGGEPDPY